MGYQVVVTVTLRSDTSRREAEIIAQEIKDDVEQKMQDGDEVETSIIEVTE